MTNASYAADADSTQTRSQNQVREPKMLMNQNQSQYRYLNNYRTGQSNSNDGSMNRQGMIDPSMQGRSLSGAMNHQAIPSRTMAGGRRQHLTIKTRQLKSQPDL